MICYGVANAIAAIGTGSIVKLTGRTPVIGFAFALHVVVITSLLLWKPTPEQKFIFFLMSGLWGVCDAIWLVQVNGQYQFYVAENSNPYALVTIKRLICTHRANGNYCSKLQKLHILKILVNLAESQFS